MADESPASCLRTGSLAIAPVQKRGITNPPKSSLSQTGYAICCHKCRGSVGLGRFSADCPITASRNVDEKVTLVAGTFFVVRLRYTEKKILMGPCLKRDSL